MKINKPIFILGSGRSGTTILYDLLAIHPDVCWFSNVMNSYPSLPAVGIINRAFSLPLIGQRLRLALVSQMAALPMFPSEGEQIYTYYGFNDARKKRWLKNKKAGETFKKYIALHIFLTGKGRFLNKRTANTQRLSIIQKLFPDAYYIHIIRDGRAVSSSLLHTAWWNTVPIWWLNGKTPSQWEEEGKEPIELCALHWKRNIEEIRKHNRRIPSRYLEIRYEDLIANVPDSMGKILAFCGLDLPKYYTNILPTRLPDMNNGWKNKLSDHQKKVLLRTNTDFLHTLGYA